MELWFLMHKHNTNYARMETLNVGSQSLILNNSLKPQAAPWRQHDVVKKIFFK